MYKKTNHLLHFIATFLTGGLWLVGWVVVALQNNGHNKRLEFESRINPDRVIQSGVKFREPEKSTYTKAFEIVIFVVVVGIIAKLMGY